MNPDPTMSAKARIRVILGRRRESEEPCSGNHTACPSGYVDWQCWAEWKARTHRQEQCPVCQLWAIWIPKEARAA